MTATSAASGGRSLPFPRLLAFSTGSTPVYIMAILVGVYLPKFYAGHIGLTLLALGGVMATVRLTDLGFDLVLGWMMDKTHTRFGRYRPWYAAGLPIFAIAAYQLFNPPPGAGTGYLFTWLIVVYVGYSMLALAHSAWAARIAGAYHERSRLFGWMQCMAVLGTSSILALPLITGGRINPAVSSTMGAVGWVLIGVACVVVPLALISAHEPVASEIKKDRTTFQDYLAVITTPSMYRLVIAELCLVLGPGVTGPIYLFFFHDAKGFAFTIVNLLLIPYMSAGLLGAPVWARVAQKLGKPRTIQLACVCYAITQTILMAIPAKLFWPTFVGMFAVGFCASAFLFLLQAMAADVGDELRLRTGKERSGVIYAFLSMMQKFGSSITVSVIFPILAVVGYNAKETAVNTPAAIHGLEMCYLFAPIILVAVGGLLLIGYKLTPQRHAEIRADLAALEAASLADAEVSLTGEPAEKSPMAAE
ncbi:MAG TPA: MFS transporter [Phenylobacterium sp.]|uniref:MFS transporter n=1 Tax=Phenylobacterium sp. TaxID=1871053 RepID=UPI002CE7910C|nr:MFS transporter [Phenylobacterium sp.]HSV03473.1 MFS transporter [Phenylobacterium sp.]